MLHGTNIASIAMSQGDRGESEVSRWWKSSSIRSNKSNFEGIHFNRSTKLDMQDVLERTQRSNRAFTLPTLSMFVSLISLAVRLFISLVPTHMYVHTFRTLY